MEIIRGTGSLIIPGNSERIIVRYTINLIRPTREKIGRWYGSISIATPDFDSMNLVPFMGQKLQLHLEDGRNCEIALTSINRFNGEGPFE